MTSDEKIKLLKPKIGMIIRWKGCGYFGKNKIQTDKIINVDDKTIIYCCMKTGMIWSNSINEFIGNLEGSKIISE